MSIELGLRIGAIGLPLITALVIWRTGEKLIPLQRLLVVIIFSIVGLFGLILFVNNQYYACILLSGKQNCLFEALATLSLFLLNVALAVGRAVTQDEDRRIGDLQMLLLSSSWAGMGLAKNLIVFVVFLNLFLFTLHHWLKRKDIKWRFLVLRDDFEDEKNKLDD